MFPLPLVPRVPLPDPNLPLYKPRDLCMVAPAGHPRFRLGRVVATPGAVEALARLSVAPATLLGRHERGDWGDLCPEDKNANDDAVAQEGDPERQGRVLSAYG